MNPLNPVYCLNCKAALEETATFCLMCGRDQRLSSAPPLDLLPTADRAAPPINTRILAMAANIAAAVILTPLLFFCIWRHPFACLLAIAIGVLPFLAVFYKQFRRNPVIPAAIACCLCLFCNQVLDAIHESRNSERSERLAEAAPPDELAPTMPTYITPSITAAPTTDTPPLPQTPQRQRRRGVLLRMFRNRRHRGGDGGNRPGMLSRRNGGNRFGSAPRGLGQDAQGVGQAFGDGEE